MSINIPTHYVEQFRGNVELKLQQRGSKLSPFITPGSYVGEGARFIDQFGEVEMQEVVSRFAPMGRVDAPADARWVHPSDWDLPQLIDKFDKLRLLTDPESKYVTNAVYAAGRKKDDLIIDAFFGTAKTGKSGTVNTAFPAGQVVAVNFEAASNSGLTVAKLREAKRLLMAAEVDLEVDPISCVVTAKQHDDLLKQAQIVSTEFNDRPVLVDGKVTRFLGINIIHCERLDVDGSSFRRVPIWARSGMHLGTWNDITTSISKRNDLQSEPWQAYVYMTMGASRTEEEKVVEVKCAE